MQLKHELLVSLAYRRQESINRGTVLVYHTNTKCPKCSKKWTGRLNEWSAIFVNHHTLTEERKDKIPKQNFGSVDHKPHFIALISVYLHNRMQVCPEIPCLQIFTLSVNSL